MPKKQSLLACTKEAVKNTMHAMGFDVIKYRSYLDTFPSDFDEGTIQTIQAIRPTLSSNERVYGLCQAVEYVVKNNIPGAFVECGVWKGGSMMAMALTLLRLGDTSRHLYLYDTFEGMTPPTDKDVNYRGQTADEMCDEEEQTQDNLFWVISPLEDVKARMESTGYPPEKIHYIKGMVEDTLPAQSPAEQIALLRLDTDWYESTKHEMVHLYPQLVQGGVLLIDDYGHWAGARQAVDEYIAEQQIKLLLNRLDYTARIGVKI